MKTIDHCISGLIIILVFAAFFFEAGDPIKSLLLAFPSGWAAGTAITTFFD